VYKGCREYKVYREYKEQQFKGPQAPHKELQVARVYRDCRVFKV
jgi:hypothetical protein